jgi:hypothetical protein
MSQVPPAENHSIPAVDGASQPQAASKPKSKGSRALVLLLLFICLIGAAGYTYWTTVRDEKLTDNVVKTLLDRGISVTVSQGEAQDSSFPLFQSLASTKIIRIGSGNARVSDEDLKEISHMNQDLDLVLDGCPVSDDGLANLKGKRNIRWLKLRGTKVDDAGISLLKGMNLETLDLTSTKVTNKGLETLGQFDMPRLKELSVASTSVTDDGMKYLGGFKTLEWLAVGNSKVTAQGKKQLKSKLPELTVLGVN